MSTPREPLPALVFISALSAEWDLLAAEIISELGAVAGPLDSLSEALDFPFTSYYDRELGKPLTRRILAFSHLAPQDRLAGLKLATNALEKALSRPDGTRRVNLDPGLLTLERVVLATCKHRPQRIYLGSGVFADLTLIFRHGCWQKLPWTFPDYAGRELSSLLLGLREAYKSRLAALGH